MLNHLLARERIFLPLLLSELWFPAQENICFGTYQMVCPISALQMSKSFETNPSPITLTPKHYDVKDYSSGLSYSAKTVRRRRGYRLGGETNKALQVSAKEAD